MIIKELEGEKKEINLNRGILSISFDNFPEIWIGENTIRDAIFHWLNTKTQSDKPDYSAVQNIS